MGRNEPAPSSHLAALVEDEHELVAEARPASSSLMAVGIRIPLTNLGAASALETRDDESERIRLELTLGEMARKAKGRGRDMELADSLREFPRFAAVGPVRREADGFRKGQERSVEAASSPALRCWRLSMKGDKPPSGMRPAFTFSFDDRATFYDPIAND